jgi:hypothetical protein
MNRATNGNLAGAAALAVLLLSGSGFAQQLSPAAMSKVQAKANQLQAWSADPAIVSAVKAHNAAPPAEYKDMTQQKWTSLSVLDPLVRAFTKNALGQYLKGLRDAQISECFVSGADGTKVAFLAKTTNWSHRDKDKHKVPMAGRVYIGPAELDESTGLQQVQIGLPVLDGGKPIGSIVVGVAVSKL